LAACSPVPPRLREAVPICGTPVPRSGTSGHTGQVPIPAEVAVELGKRGYDYVEEFEFGLDFILEGLERFARTIRSSRA
jgi:hypothetical protein